MSLRIDTQARTEAVRFQNQTGSPTAPSAGYSLIFLKADGAYVENSTGTVVGPLGVGGSSLAFGKKVLTSADKTTNSTSFVDVDSTNMSITLTTGAHRCRITVTAAGKNSTTAQSQLDVDLDGARLGQAFGLTFMQGASNQNLSFSFITDVLTAASHTFKLQFRVDGGTMTLYASAAVSPLVFSVEELPY